MTEDSDLSKRGDSQPSLHVGHGWLRGALIAATGVLIGAIALGVFCYALGVNLTEEGWSENHRVDRVALVGALTGFAVATLMFWIGFVQLTRAAR